MTNKPLSQNFLWNRELVYDLLRDSSISQDDLVYEIGAGTGIITEELLRICRRVVAFEVDPTLANILRTKFAQTKNLSIINTDFLKFPLPASGNYKIFSNIPYSITGEIMKKLAFATNPPLDAYLIVQKEAGEKFTVGRGTNTMLAILFFPWFEIEIIHQFSRGDFRPRPNVDSVLLRINRRNLPHLEFKKPLFRDYVAYRFNKSRSAKNLSPKDWLADFETFLESNDQKMKKKVMGSFEKWRKEEQRLSKIHRTRLDRHWRG